MVDHPRQQFATLGAVGCLCRPALRRTPARTVSWMRHWIPLSTTYSIALSTARMSRLRGRPPGFATGTRSLIQSHWRSLKSVGYVWFVIPQVYPIWRDDRLLTLFSASKPPVE